MEALVPGNHALQVLNLNLFHNKATSHLRALVARKTYDGARRADTSGFYVLGKFLQVCKHLGVGKITPYASESLRAQEVVVHSLNATHRDQSRCAQSVLEYEFGVTL